MSEDTHHHSSEVDRSGNGQDDASVFLARKSEQASNNHKRQKHGQQNKELLEAHSRYVNLSRRLGPPGVTFSALEIRLRVAVLQELNVWLLRISPFLDCAQCGWEDEARKNEESEIEIKNGGVKTDASVSMDTISMSLGSQVSCLRGLVFQDTKARLWNNAILYTIANPPSITEGTALGSLDGGSLRSICRGSTPPHY